MVGIPQALKDAGSTAYRAVRNIPTTVSNISVSPSFSHQAIDLTRSTKEHSQTGNVLQRHLVAPYLQLVAAVAETVSGAARTVEAVLNMPICILRLDLLGAGKSTITALKTAVKTVGFVAASVVLAVAGIFFPETAFSALDREVAERETTSFGTVYAASGDEIAARVIVQSENGVQYSNDTDVSSSESESEGEKSVPQTPQRKHRMRQASRETNVALEAGSVSPVASENGSGSLLTLLSPADGEGRVVAQETTSHIPRRTTRHTSRDTAAALSVIQEGASPAPSEDGSEGLLARSPVRSEVDGGDLIGLSTPPSTKGGFDDEASFLDQAATPKLTPRGARQVTREARALDAALLVVDTNDSTEQAG
ncbi:hypothetical protein COB11_01110 [Candidatus Aerophobetes bacterium]|uniref:Uncharacterized protein n=1 Tax=Aerophobetes bacterium TaxID=2030807 RepID=A0A2A4YLV7_UNCAE|nr:MAG: hypothetical protein COB11_01110 [Candidatus Aerophobetes bacterium]